MSNKTEKENGMNEKKLFGNDKEIRERIDEVILKELDNLNYALDKDLGIKNEDAERLKELIDTRNANKRGFWDIVKTVAQTLGIGVTMAATIVGIVYTVKGHKFDIEWMNKIFEMKDSVNVIDPNSRNVASKHRDNQRRLVDHVLNKKLDIFGK